MMQHLYLYVSMSLFQGYLFNLTPPTPLPSQGRGGWGPGQSPSSPLPTQEGGLGG
jgi:hypothetical protein